MSFDHRLNRRIRDEMRGIDSLRRRDPEADAKRAAALKAQDDADMAALDAAIDAGDDDAVDAMMMNMWE